MASNYRLLLILVVGAIIAGMGGQHIFSRLPIDQYIAQVHSDMGETSEVTEGSEDSVVPLTRLGGVWVAHVEINELYDARLIVDTGATYTMLSEDLAFDVGVYSDSRHPHIELFTVGGNIQAQMGTVSRIRLGNVGREDVEVVVHTIPNLPHGVDGLLGLSFFDRFVVRFDQTSQELHLSPRF